MTYSRRSSIGEVASTGAGSGGSASPNGSIAAIIRGSARGSSRSVIAGEPSRPGSTGEPMVTSPLLRARRVSVSRRWLASA